MKRQGARRTKSVKNGRIRSWIMRRARIYTPHDTPLPLASEIALIRARGPFGKCNMATANSPGRAILKRESSPFTRKTVYGTDGAEFI